jgi:hypothetical protein
MTKMDMVWLATANLLHPHVESTRTVTRGEIESEVNRLFGADVQITSVLIDRHLVSFEDRHADHAIPARGGSRNRYLFRTENGNAPSRQGRFRLYKAMDGAYDGIDKTGPTHPDPANVDAQRRHLITWYMGVYAPAL